MENFFVWIDLLFDLLNRLFEMEARTIGNFEGFAERDTMMLTPPNLYGMPPPTV
jgi:hypothetical protein